MKREILLTVGPVNTSERIKKALLIPDMCHREKEFYDLLSAVRKKLVSIVNGDENYTSVVFTGSGTASVEAVISAIYGKLFTIINGSYGERIDEIAKRYGIDRVTVDFNLGYPNLNKVEDILKNDENITHIAVVHNETTTGLLNPVHEIGNLAKKYKKSFIVDAMSSLGGHKLDVVRDHIDYCISGPNKCLEGLPGVSFVIVKKDLLEALKDKQPRNLYLDLYNQYRGEENGEIPFTFAIQTLAAFDEALDALFEEGLENRILRYQKLSKQLRDGLEGLGLKFPLPRERLSNVVTTVLLPKNVKFNWLHDRLKKKGFVIYAGKGSLGVETFRLGNMGAITEEDIKDFLSELRNVLGDIKQEKRTPS